MPSVPTYQDSVRPVALNPEFTQMNTRQYSPDAFGAGIGRAVQSVGAGAETIATARSRYEQLKADALATEGVNRLQGELDKHLYDPEGGYLNTEGSKAMAGYKALEEKVKASTNSIRDSLPTEAARNSFDKQAAQMRTQTLRQGMAHDSRETKSFIVNQEAAAIERLADAADPADYDNWAGSMGEAIARQENADALHGLPDEQIEQHSKQTRSHFVVSGVQKLAMSDPAAAIKFAMQHFDMIRPEDQMRMLQDIKPMVKMQAEHDAVQAHAGNPAPNQFAATGLSGNDRAMLSVISGGEAPGYNILNGGERFSDFSQHPSRIGKGGTSTASGRYQFIKNTWLSVADKNGFTDFSPANQDRGAIWLARADYRQRTGRDLSADIAAGNFAQIRKGLSSTWESFKFMSDEQFANKMRAAQAANGTEQAPYAAGQAPAKGGPTIENAANQTTASAGNTFSPEFENVLGHLPPMMAAEMRAAGDAAIAKFQTAMAAQEKVTAAASLDNYQLRIATGDPELTEDDILHDATMDNGQKATLINSYHEKRKAGETVAANIAAYQVGEFHPDPFTDQGRKASDDVYRVQAGAAVNDQQRQAVLYGHVKQTGIVPTSVINGMRGAFIGNNPTLLAASIGLAMKIEEADADALRRAPNGSDISEKVAIYRHLTQQVGLTSSVALARIGDMNNPEKIREREALGKTDIARKAVDAQATAGNVSAAFGGGMFSGPSVGTNPIQEAGIVGHYKETFADALTETSGNVEAAKALANERFQRVYGVTSFDPSGKTGVISHLPPEKTYPADGNGSHGYVRAQAIADLKAQGVTANEVYLVSTPTTAGDVAAGRSPRYQLFYKDASGTTQAYHLPFSAVPPTSADIASQTKAANDAMTAENARKQDAARSKPLARQTSNPAAEAASAKASQAKVDAEAAAARRKAEQDATAAAAQLRSTVLTGQSREDADNASVAALTAYTAEPETVKPQKARPRQGRALQ